MQSMHPMQFHATGHTGARACRRHRLFWGSKWARTAGIDFLRPRAVIGEVYYTKACFHGPHTSSIGFPLAIFLRISIAVITYTVVISLNAHNDLNLPRKAVWHHACFFNLAITTLHTSTYRMILLNSRMCQGVSPRPLA